MNMVLTIVGIFAGIGVFLASMYSMSQIFLLDGRSRIAHAVNFVMILIVMGALMERAVPVARILAVPLFLTATWCFVIEPRWYRIMPVLVQIFAVILMLGYVAMS